MSVNFWKGEKAGVKNKAPMFNGSYEPDKEFFLGVYERFGPEEACRLYGITSLTTLFNLLNTDDRGRQRKLTQSARAEMKSDIALEGYEAANKMVHQAVAYMENKFDRQLTMRPVKGWLIEEVDEDNQYDD